MPHREHHDDECLARYLEQLYGCCIPSFYRDVQLFFYLSDKHRSQGTRLDGKTARNLLRRIQLPWNCSSAL